MVTGVKANHLYEIDEAAAGEVLEAGVPVRRPHFSDVSDLLRHTHHEEAFDDFALQPTLSKRMSQLGPGVSWFDVDADGWDDLIIGSGRGGHLAVFRNDGLGGFVRLEGLPFAQAITRDQTTVLGWRKPGGGTVLLAGSANYEDGLTNGSVVRQFDFGWSSSG